MKFKINPKYLKPLDYLFILRPTLFFPVWVATLAGYAAYFLHNNTIVWWNFHFSWSILFNFILITLCCGGAFILNQLHDIETDKENKKLFLIAENIVSQSVAKKVGYALIGITLVLFLIQNLALFLIAAGVVLIGGYCYNYNPFAWKNKPIMGILTNMIVVGLLLFMFGWRLGGAIAIDTIGYAVPYILAIGSIAILTTIPDMEGDRNTGKVTFAVRYGEKISIWVSFIMIALAFVIGLLNDDPVISHSILISSPLYIILLFKQDLTWVLRTIRYPILFIALFLSVEFPYFFVVILANYYLSKIYYATRFNLDYPSFKIEEETHDKSQSASL